MCKAMQYSTSLIRRIIASESKHSNALCNVLAASKSLLESVFGNYSRDKAWLGIERSRETEDACKIIVHRKQNLTFNKTSICDQ